MNMIIHGKRRGMCGVLAEKFGCSAAFVTMSLRFESNSMKARRIRSYALNSGDFMLAEV